MDHPTITLHESQLADYHPGPGTPHNIRSVEDLELAFARAVYGDKVDADTPIGMEVLATTGRELVAPFISALLKVPGLQITFLPGPSQEGPAA